MKIAEIETIDYNTLLFSIKRINPRTGAYERGQRFVVHRGSKRSACIAKALQRMPVRFSSYSHKLWAIHIAEKGDDDVQR